MTVRISKKRYYSPYHLQSIAYLSIEKSRPAVVTPCSANNKGVIADHLITSVRRTTKTRSLIISLQILDQQYRRERRATYLKNIETPDVREAFSFCSIHGYPNVLIEPRPYKTTSLYRTPLIQPHSETRRDLLEYKPRRK